jgi:hypothetical protein
MKKLILLLLSVLILFSAAAAENISEQEYINRRTYNRNKLELAVKTRLIDIKRRETQTDIDTTTYTLEAYTYTYGTIATSSLARAETKEITDWYIYKGRVRKLSDFDFLDLVGDYKTLARISEIDNRKSSMRMIGNISIGAGLAAMIGGAAFSADQPVISAGAVATAIGFFINAFNMSPPHYIQPDYAQEKIDDYNLALKKKLNLPLEYE